MTCCSRNLLIHPPARTNNIQSQCEHVEQVIEGWFSLKRRGNRTEVELESRIKDDTW